MFLTTILSKCHPKMLSYTYTINNNLLIMTPVNSGYSELGGFIQSVSSTTLVIKSGIDEYKKYRKFTLKKAN